MTAPMEMRTPTVNRQGFQEALDKVTKYAEGLEVRTRSELQLENAIKEAEKLDTEGAEIREELKFLAALEAELIRARGILQTNEADNAAARHGMLAQIHALRESGVVPKKGS